MVHFYGDMEITCNNVVTSLSSPSLLMTGDIFGVNIEGAGGFLNNRDLSSEAPLGSPLFLLPLSLQGLCFTD